MIDHKAYDRFMTKVYPEPNSGCWLWDGGLTHRGYGQFAARINGTRRQLGAHVFSYIWHKGKVNARQVVHHRCNLPCCVNPDHLEAVSPSLNSRYYHADKRKAAKPGRPKPSWLIQLSKEIELYAAQTGSSYQTLSLNVGQGVCFVAQLMAPDWREPRFGAVVELCRVMGVTLASLEEVDSVTALVAD